MLTYKEVFQLAQEKGWIEECLARYMGDTPTSRLLELTSIQKWLRDEHKMFVIPYMQFENTVEDEQSEWFDWRYMIYSLEQLRKENINILPYVELLPDEICSGGEDIKTYEQALLEGINESLKLLS